MPINPNRITGADVHVADSLVLAIVNDGQQGEMWINRREHNRRNAIKRLLRGGGYDPLLAAKMWRYLADEYLPTFKREEADVGRVDVPTRNLAGRFLEENQREQVFSDAGMPVPKFPSDEELRAAEAESRGEVYKPSLAPTLATANASGNAPTIGG